MGGSAICENRIPPLRQYNHDRSFMPNADSSLEVPADHPPDWDARSTDLLCPLCKYNLRHLTTPRCPECGFAFSWRELLDAEANRHKYVFEHGRGQNIRTFWRTYWRTCQPRRFWTDLSPAQPVILFRLMLYWVMTAGIAAVCFSGPKVNQIIAKTRQSVEFRAVLSPMAGHPGYFVDRAGDSYSQRDVDAENPLPWQGLFWNDIFSAGRSYFYEGVSDPGQVAFYWAVIFLAWPWLTLLGLLVFRMSMRQAKILRIHLLRTVIYSCDFGFVLGIALMACTVIGLQISDGWVALAGAMLCAAFTTYRLTIAFRQYLRVHLPLATVLASQLISLLVVFLLLVQIADFSRRI
jgi:hypothetical protein